MAEESMVGMGDALQMATRNGLGNCDGLGDGGIWIFLLAILLGGVVASATEARPANP